MNDEIKYHRIKTRFYSSGEWFQYIQRGFKVCWILCVKVTGLHAVLVIHKHFITSRVNSRGSRIGLICLVWSGLVWSGLVWSGLVWSVCLSVWKSMYLWSACVDPSWQKDLGVKECYNTGCRRCVTRSGVFIFTIALSERVVHVCIKFNIFL